MDTSPRLRSGLRAGAALLPASVVAVLACWSLGGPAGTTPTLPADRASASVASAGRTPAGREVLLRVTDGLATVTLDDTPAARAFAAMVPLRVVLDDPMGQAKSGKLASPIDVTGAERVFNPSVGELYYWAPSHTIAIFYDDLGQSVPSPGLIRLGSVDSGLSAIARSGGNVRVEPAGVTIPRMGS